mmetsp:Transcript_75206/g.207465  ORF Transcript_75206/g.207465 Transcript_75206/m.207465 type:complete len:232 (-) Transcript_75206:1043-1738(-)
MLNGKGPCLLLQSKGSRTAHAQARPHALGTGPELRSCRGRSSAQLAAAGPAAGRSLVRCPAARLARVVAAESDPQGLDGLLELPDLGKDLGVLEHQGGQVHCLCVAFQVCQGIHQLVYVHLIRLLLVHQVEEPLHRRDVHLRHVQLSPELPVLQLAVELAAGNLSGAIEVCTLDHLPQLVDGSVVVFELLLYCKVGVDFGNSGGTVHKDPCQNIQHAKDEDHLIQHKGNDI